MDMGTEGPGTSSGALIPSVQSWLSGDAIQAAEALICAEAGVPDFDAFLEPLSTGQGGAGSTCVQVWDRGTIAYRCKTCQMTPASAVCPACFKAGGHEDHDYVMYKSESGGCCDCGDLSAWKFSGCCPAHRPLLSGPGSSAMQLQGAQDGIVRELLGSALTVVSLTARNLVLFARDPRLSALYPLLKGSEVSPAAKGALGWLQRCSTVAPLRTLMVEEICREFSELSCGAEGSPPDTTCARLRSVRLELATELDSDELRLLAPAPLPVLLSSLASIRSPWIGDLTTLLMVMLYDVDFKYRFSSCLCRHYQDILMQTAGNEPLSTTLDRLTVQLFSIPAITLRLVEEGNLLEIFVSALHLALKTAQPKEGEPLDPSDDHIRQPNRLHLRVLLDLKMILCHTNIAVHMMVKRPEAFHLILDTLGLMQGMCPQVRQKDFHIEQEDTKWVHGIILEEQILQLIGTIVEALETPTPDSTGVGECDEASRRVSAAAFASGGLPRCLEGRLLTPPRQVEPMDATVASLAAGAERALQRLSGWAIASEFPESIPHIGKELFEGAPVSLNLPLHRAAGAFLQGLMVLAEGDHGGRAAEAAAAVQSLMEGTWLEGVPGSEAVLRESTGSSVPAFAWRLVATHPLRLLVWLSQVRARLWIRNGLSMLQVDSYYRNVFWRDVVLDMDHLLLQLWLAATPWEHKPQAMMEILEAFGAQPLIRGVVMAKPADSSELGQAAFDPTAMEEPQLMCTVAGVRLIVTLLRESHIVCGTRKRLRHQLIHHLAVGNKGYNVLSEGVAHGLRSTSAFDAVLAEVAVYVDPDLRQQGHYKLRPECWAEFDPLFLHFQPQELQAAMDRAHSSGQYQPHFQLRAVSPLPSVLRQMHDVLLSRRCQLLEWACLRYAHLHPSNGALELASSAMQLMSLAVAWLKSEDVAPGRVGTGRSRLAQMLSGSGPQWMYGPGGLEGLRALSEAADASADVRGCAEHLLVDARAVVKEAEPPGSPSALPLPSLKLGTPARGGTSPPDSSLSGDEGRHRGERKRSSDGAPKAGAGGSSSPASSPGGGSSEQRRRKARQRQQEMMRRMAMQQAAFSAQALEDDDSSDGPAGGSTGALSASASGSEAMMELETAEAKEHQEEDRSPRAAAPIRPPWHDPSQWVEPQGECIYCHLGAGGDSGPLGSLCHTQVNAVPVFALRDYSETRSRINSAASSASTSSPSPSPSPSAAAGAPAAGAPAAGAPVASSPAVAAAAAVAGAVAAAAAGAQDPRADDSRAGGSSIGGGAGPAGIRASSGQSSGLFGCGPMISEVDCRPGQAVLSCGHMMHQDCFQRFRKDRGSSEFLCPICRRLSNGLLPAAGSVGSAACPERPPTASRRHSSSTIGASPSSPPAAGTSSQQLCVEFLAKTSLEGRPARGLVQALLGPGSSGDEAAADGPDGGARAAAQSDTSRLPAGSLSGAALEAPWKQRLGPRSEMASQFLRSSCGMAMKAARSVLAQGRAQGRGITPRRARTRTVVPAAEEEEDPMMDDADDVTDNTGTNGNTEEQQHEEEEEGEEEEEEEEEEEGYGSDGAGVPLSEETVWWIAENEERGGGGGIPDEVKTMLLVQGGPSGTLWGIVGHTLVQWEVMQRGPAFAPEQDALVRSAYWRSLRGLVAVAAAAGSCLRDWRRDRKSPDGTPQGSRGGGHEVEEEGEEGGGRGGGGGALNGGAREARMRLSRYFAAAREAADGVGEGNEDLLDAVSFAPPAALLAARGVASLGGGASSGSSLGAHQLPPEGSRASAASRWREVLRFLLDEPSSLKAGAHPSFPPPMPILASMVPRLRQEELHPPRPPLPKQGPSTAPGEAWKAGLSDPFVLVLELLALACALEPDEPPEDSLAAILPAVYVVAANQAALAAVASREHQAPKGTAATIQEVSRILSLPDDSPEATETISSVARQLGPLLARLLGLRALLAGDEEPQGPFLGAGDDALAGALGLPSTRQALLLAHGQPDAPSVLARWCGPVLRAALDRQQQQQQQQPSQPLLCCADLAAGPPPRPGLMPLPQLYHNLFLALSSRTCDTCGKVPNDPALCLLTGAFVCCDSHNGCLKHAWKHGAGTGVFLLTKVTQLLILRSGERACNSHPSTCLYLDAHGEEDTWMRRGRALHLSEPRYRQVAALWSAGALDYDTSILFASFPVHHNRLHPSDRDRLLYRTA